MAHHSARPALQEALISAPRGVRRACVLFVGKLPTDEIETMLTPLTDDRDPVVASRAAQALARTLRRPALQATFGPLLRSRVGRVRLVALEALVASGDDDVDGALRRALLDEAAPIRELARFELGRRGSTDFLASYVTAMRSGEHSVLVPALSGLRECGTRPDAPLALPFVSHPSARVRAAALRALGRLDPESHVLAFASALEDPSRRVLRAASEGLRGRGHLVEASRLQSLLDMPGSPGAVTALGLLCETGYWGALEVALSAARRDEPALQSAAVNHLERLTRQQTYARPSNLHAIELALEAAAERLPFDLRRRLEGSLAAAHRMK